MQARIPHSQRTAHQVDSKVLQYLRIGPSGLIAPHSNRFRTVISRPQGTFQPLGSVPASPRPVPIPQDDERETTVRDRSDAVISPPREPFRQPGSVPAPSLPACDANTEGMEARWHGGNERSADTTLYSKSAGRSTLRYPSLRPQSTSLCHPFTPVKLEGKIWTSRRTLNECGVEFHTVNARPTKSILKYFNT